MAAAARSWRAAGASELKLDDALLTQGKLAIVSARGVLPDGTPFNIPADDPAPAPLNVEESLRDGIVYLGLPLKRVGTRDTVEEGEALGGARYVSQVQEVRDDNAAFEPRAGGPGQPGVPPADRARRPRRIRRGGRRAGPRSARTRP